MKPPTHICSYLIFVAIFAVVAAFGQSPAPSPAASINPQELQRQVQQLKQENQQLKQENQRLRELLSQGNTNTRTAPVAQPAGTYAPQTAASTGSSDQKALTHWLTTSSNKRHNSSCRWFKNSKGRPCRADEGIPCKICGG
jgi:Skp family chaperone for outer membrane proteins